MVKVLKTAFIVVLVVVIVLAAVVLIIYPRGTEYTEKQLYPYANWMTDLLKEDVPLVNVAIPGSHDAGAADLDESMFTLAKYLLICQNAPIREQLKCGVRYFDLRTMLDGDELYIQHGDFKTQKFSTVVNDIKNYLEEYDDVLILNMQHFTDDASAQKTYEYMVANIPNFVNICVTTDTEIATITMASMRESGKRLFIIWGRDLNPNRDILFVDSNDVLYSPYIGDIHSSSDEALLAQLDTYIADSAEKQVLGFFNLQCQRTWGSNELLKGPEQLEEIFAEKANDYIKNISDEQLQHINIIHRDFVTDGEKIKLIIELNERKGTLK